jgi:hypothetical protein
MQRNQSGAARRELRAIGIEVAEDARPERIGELMAERIAAENSGTAPGAITRPGRELIAAAAPELAKDVAGLALVVCAMSRLDRWDADAARICANRALSDDDRCAALLALPAPLHPEQAAHLQAALPACNEQISALEGAAP